MIPKAHALVAALSGCLQPEDRPRLDAEGRAPLRRHARQNKKRFVAGALNATTKKPLDAGGIELAAEDNPQAAAPCAQAVPC